jgi:hypothetical protein
MWFGGVLSHDLSGQPTVGAIVKGDHHHPTYVNTLRREDQRPRIGGEADGINSTHF